MSFEPELQARSAAIEQQAALIERCADPATRAAALDLLRSVMDLHKSALQRMLAILQEAGQAGGDAIIDRLARDPLVDSVLVLHDLHPDDLETRVLRALEELQPKLRRYGAEARLISVADDVIRAALEAPTGCGSPLDTLKTAIEEALLSAAPDAEIVIDVAAPNDSGFVSIETLMAPAARSSHPAAHAIASNRK
jgi:Fe-S cluster biogenesis protein NfuA